MIYKLNRLGVYQPLLDAVNKVKSGKNTTLTITYAYDQSSFTGIQSRTLNIDAFKTDILNSMFQWEKFASYVYSDKIHFKGNLTLKFKEVDLGSQDVIISFANMKQELSVSKTEIKFNKELSWGTSEIPNIKDIMSYAVYAIGFLFGLSPAGGINPMSSKYLGKNFNLANNITPTENGVVTTPVLHRYKRLFNHFKKIYGLLNNKTELFYGCTDPNAENYDPAANTDDGSCIEKTEIIPHRSTNYYNLKSIRSTAEANISNAHYDLMYNYNSDGPLYSYGTEGIIFKSNTNISVVNSSATSSSGRTSIFASVTSLDNGILNVVSIDYVNLGSHRSWSLNIKNRLNEGIAVIGNSLTGQGPDAANTDPYNTAIKNSFVKILDNSDGNRKLNIILPDKNYLLDINLDATSADSSGIDCVNTEDELGLLINAVDIASPNWATSSFPSLVAPFWSDYSETVLYQSQITGIQAVTDMENEVFPTASVPGIFPFNDVDWVSSKLPTSTTSEKVYSLGGSNNEGTTNLYFNRFTAFMSGHLKKFERSQKSIPEIKVLTISPIQDSYIIQRHAGLTDGSNVLLRPNSQTATILGISPGNNLANKHFAHDKNIDTIVYEFSNGYEFYDNSNNVNLSFGLQRASISPWTKNGLNCGFNGTLSAEEESTLVVPLKEYPMGIGVITNTEQSSTGPLGTASQFASAAQEGAGAITSAGSFDDNAIFVAQAIDVTVDSDNNNMFRACIANPAFDIDNTSLAFHTTNNYPLIISKRLRSNSIVDSTGIGDSPYDYNASGEALGDNNLFYGTALGETNVAYGNKLVFIGMKYGIFITRIDNISGELNHNLQLYIPAGDNSLLGYADAETYEGGFLMVDFAISLHDNFLYAIVEDPDSADRHIVVYDITSAYLADDEEQILNNSKSIPNPFSANLSSVTLEKDGNIYFYSDNSTEYLRVTEPDLQVNVDILLNYPSTLILEVPISGEGMYIQNLSSNIFDFLKFHASSGYLPISDQSTEPEISTYNGAYSLDLLTDMQLNITPDLNPGQHLPIADQEKYRLLSDSLLFNLEYGEAGDFYTPIDSVGAVDLLLDAIGSRLDFTRNNRIINLGNHTVGIISFNSDHYTLYDRAGGVLASFDPSFELINVENIIDGAAIDYRIIGTQVLGEVGRQTLVIGYYTLTFPVDADQEFDSLGISLGNIDSTVEGFTSIENYSSDVTIVDSFITNTDENNTTHLYFAVVDTSTFQSGILKINKYIINASGVTSESILEIDVTTINIAQLTSSNFSNSILKIHGNTLVLSFDVSLQQNASQITPALLIQDLSVSQNPTYVVASTLTRIHISSLEIVKDNIFYICVDEDGITQEFSYYNLVTSGYLPVPKLTQQLFSSIDSGVIEQYPSDFDLCVSECEDNDFSSKVNYNPNDTTVSDITGLLKHPNGQIYISTSRVPAGGQYLSRVLYAQRNTPSYALHIAEIILENNNISEARSAEPINFRSIAGQSGGIIEDPNPTFDSAFFMPVWSCIDPAYTHWCGYSQEDADDAAAGAAIYHLTGLCGQEPSEEAQAVCPNGGCESNWQGNTGNAFNTVYACGTCSVQDFVQGAADIDLQICGVCPCGTPNAIECSSCGVAIDPATGMPIHNYGCQEDVRICQYEGCNDMLPPSSLPPNYGPGNLQGLGLSCNGFGHSSSYQGVFFDQAEGGIYPNAEHNGDLCLHPTSECQCDGAGGLETTPISDLPYEVIPGTPNDTGWINCTDCSSPNPEPTINTSRIYNTYVNEYIALYADYNADSYNEGNSIVPWPMVAPVVGDLHCYCNHYRTYLYGTAAEQTELVTSLWNSRGVCDCAGGTPAAPVTMAMESVGPYCNCFGQYDETKYCDCNTKKDSIGPFCDCDGNTTFANPAYACYHPTTGQLLCDEEHQYYAIDIDEDGKYKCGFDNYVELCPSEAAYENEQAGYTKYIKAIGDSFPCDDCEGEVDCHGTCIPYDLEGNLTGEVAVLDECGHCGGPGPIYDCPNADGVEGCLSLPDPTIDTHPVTGEPITNTCDCSGNIDYGCGCGVETIWDPYINQNVAVPLNGGGNPVIQEGEYVLPCDVHTIYDYCTNIYVRNSAHSNINPEFTFDEQTGFIVAQHQLNQLSSGGSDQIYYCSCPTWNEDAGAWTGNNVGPTECCPGYTYVACHGCRENSVAATLATEVDCDGRCPGTEGYLGVYDPATNTGGGIDVCGVCGGTGLNASGCCGSDIKDCNDECSDEATATSNDQCGVCGGDNSTCSGCTDPNAYNYDENATINDGTCEYFQVTNIDDYPVIDTVDGTSTPNFHQGIVITHHNNVQVTTRPYSADNEYDGVNLSIGLPLTIRKLYIFNEDISLGYLDTNSITYHSVKRDNPTVTSKCQIITRNSPLLYLTNVAAYGESAYTIEVDVHLPPGASVETAYVGVDTDTITDALEPNVIGENTVATITERTAVFYFRVEADADNASPFKPSSSGGVMTLEEIFTYQILLGRVISVEKEDTPDVTIIEAGVVSDEQITSTVLKFNWAQNFENPNEDTASSVIVSDPQPNYHVYKVIMAVGADGLPFDVSTPIDFTPYFSTLSNTTVQKPVCGSCDSDFDGLPTGFEILNPGGIPIGGVEHYSYYGLTPEQFLHLYYGNTITVTVEDPTTTTQGVIHEYFYDADKCAAACIDLCYTSQFGDQVEYQCCDENANNYVEDPDGFWPSCKRCWAEYLPGPNPCIYPTPDPTPVCCYPDYAEYWANWGIDINDNPIDPVTGQPGNYLCDPTQCVTLQIGETDPEIYEDDESNFSTVIQSLPGTNPNIEFFIFDKEGRILFDHSELLRKGGRSVRYNNNNSTLIERKAAIRSMSPCAGFVPIAFKTNEDWLNLRLTITDAMAAIFGLDFGQINPGYLLDAEPSTSLTDLAYGSSSDNSDGSAVLKVGNSECSIGCNDLTIDLPESCVRQVAMDVKEFTEFTVEIITEESPVQSYTGTTEFIVYNIETGEKLINLNNASPGFTKTESFRLTRSTPIGVKATSANMLIYNIKDEQGTIIQTKHIYNDSYFEPFKIELVVPGCTDTTAANYDSNAGLDDGSCLDAALYDCVKSALFDIDILQCDTRENTRSLQIYTIYQSYKESVAENNEVKIEMYGDKLKDLCNCETC